MLVRRCEGRRCAKIHSFPAFLPISFNSIFERGPCPISRSGAHGAGGRGRYLSVSLHCHFKHTTQCSPNDRAVPTAR